jgi:hypothetical protein
MQTLHVVRISHNKFKIPKQPKLASIVTGLPHKNEVKAKGI